SVEVQVGLLGHVQVRLFQDQGHAQDALIEADRVLWIRANQGDVVNAGNRDLYRHDISSWSTPHREVRPAVPVGKLFLSPPSSVLPPWTSLTTVSSIILNLPPIPRRVAGRPVRR